MNKKYAIFDMDGTLVDSMKYWRSLGREYLESKGVTEDLAEVLELIKPMTMSESAAVFVERFSLPLPAEKAEAEMNGMMEMHYRRDIPLKSGVREYLENLHQKGVRMCVASATAEELMEACLKRLEVAQYFEFLLSCETVGAGKSQPDIYFEAMRRFNASQEEIAVYEDASYAVRTAKKAGFYVIGVYEEAEKYKEEVQKLSDYYLISF